MSDSFDVIVIGSGPGGYVAALKAAAAGKRTALVEREDLGGVCLNWGCIPTKALIRSAELLQAVQQAGAYGITVAEVSHDFAAIVARSRSVAGKMSKGIAFLVKKRKVEVLRGSGRLLGEGRVAVAGDDGERILNAPAIILATGASPRSFPELPVDGERVFHARKAMSLASQPKSLLCIGAGAIGMEFAWFYAALGTKVTVVEVLDQVLPVEDHEVAQVVERSFRKDGIDIHTGTRVLGLDLADPKQVVATIEKAGKQETLQVERVLVAVGMAPNSADLGLEEAGVTLDARGFVQVDANMCSSVPSVYAIGDLAGRQLLAHKASAEAEAAVGHILGHAQPVSYDQIPGCTYCHPQVASIGLNERKASEVGITPVIGRFNFMASGKAAAQGDSVGFVKLLFEPEYLALIGAHLVGHDVTELIGELAIALKLESTAHEIAAAVHAHPTMSEAVMEAALDALGDCVHQ